MKDSDLKDYRRKIDARITELTMATDNAQESRQVVELDQQSVGRLSRMDAIERQAMAEATNRLRQNEMSQLRAAIRRIEDGDFGYCVDCGENIEKNRLSKHPTVLRCVDCATG